MELNSIKLIKMQSIPLKSYALLLGLLLFLFSGCVTKRDIEYLQKNNRTPKSFKESEFLDYRLKPNDELYVRVNSLDDPLTNVFSTATGRQSAYADNLSPYSASLTSYVINKEGYLSLPLVGDIYAKDKTLSEVNIILTDSLSHILSQPIVTIKLVNRFVSVLGEVRVPGHYTYSQEKLTIFDALGLAGDMVKYSNRKDVILTRNENGKNMLVSLDLTKPEILESEYYYIRPNDIIYVKPLEKRVWGTPEFPFALILSTLTFTILLYSYIN